MADFEKHIVALYGEEGKQWLETIPSILKIYEEKWNIKILKPFPLFYNYVASVVCKKSKAVIKISFPKNKEFATEMQALTIFNGDGAIKLLQEDTANSVALLELCEPGTILKNFGENKEQTEIAAAVMQALWKKIPKNHIFPTVADWGKGFARYKQTFNKSGPISMHIIQKAEDTYNRLLQSSSENYLLHGDLHHENILLSKRGWLAIDPKGVIGERAYDIGCFLRNPYPSLVKFPNAKEITRKRITIFSKTLNLDEKRIAQWAFAQCILSAVWVAEERGQYVDYYLSAVKLFT